VISRAETAVDFQNYQPALGHSWTAIGALLACAKACARALARGKRAPRGPAVSPLRSVDKRLREECGLVRDCRRPADINYTRDRSASSSWGGGSALPAQGREFSLSVRRLIMNERHSRRSDRAIKIISYLVAVIVTSAC